MNRVGQFCCMAALAIISILVDAPLGVAETPEGRIESMNDGTRIIIGTEVKDPKKYPFQIALVYASAAPGEEFSMQFCGGTLIADRWVLTAAHCAAANGKVPRLPENFFAYVGSLDFKGGERIGIAKKPVIHDHYDPSAGMMFDFALVKLERAPTVPNVKPITMDQSAGLDSLVNARVIAIGWGDTERNVKSSTLRETSLRVVSQQQCRNKLTAVRLERAQAILSQTTGRLNNDSSKPTQMVGKVVQPEPALVDDSMICAGAPADDMARAALVADICHGDSGGPLLRQSDTGRYTQVGIISWGYGCGYPGRFAVFARVSAVRQWIETTINGDE